MEHLDSYPPVPFAGSVLTIGTFDGVHLGHQAVLRRLVEEAHERGVPSVVVTFANHPKDILRPERAVDRLGTPQQKREWIAELGVDVMLELFFTEELKEKSAQEFLNEMKECFQFKHLVLGHDAHFGKGRAGNPEFVAAQAGKMDYTFEYLESIEHQGQTVSSTAIRTAIREGDLSQAAQLLGRFYAFSAEVVHGDGRGKQIGYATANLNVIGRALPPLGVYEIIGRCKNGEWVGIANLGCSPTMKEGAGVCLEVHLLDFSGDLYGEELEVELHRFIRPEQKFDGVEALRAQIAEDIATIQSHTKRSLP